MGPMKRLRLTLVFVMWLSLSATWICGTAPTPAHAEGRKASRKAQRVFKEGQAFFEKGMYTEAAARFLKASQIDPHPVIMYNVGRAYEEDGELVKALQFYRAAIGLEPSSAVEAQLTAKIKDVEIFLRSEGVDVLNLGEADWVPKAQLTISSDPSDAEVFVNGSRLGLTPITRFPIPQGVATVEIRRSGYRTAVQELTVIAGKTYTVNPKLSLDNASTSPSSYGTLEVTSATPGLTVFIDREPVGTTPLEALAVKAGEHSVSVEGEDFPTYEETILITAGEPTEVRATLPAPVVVKQTKTEIMTDAQWGWTALISGGALVGVGAGFGVFALTEGSAYMNDKGAVGRADHRDAAEFNALIADILYGSGFATAAVGGALLWWAGRDGADEPDSALGWRIVPTASRASAGAAAILSW